MEKPMMVAREEFAQEIAKVVNESGLHPAIMQPILETINNELKAFMQQQYEKEKAEYEKAAAEEETEAE